MYMLDTRKRKIQLARLSPEVQIDPLIGSVSVSFATVRNRDPVGTRAQLARASRAFFNIGERLEAAAPAARPEGPPPVAFRESATGFHHVIYHEIVIRFAARTSEKRRRSILRQKGFEIRRGNPFIPDQMIVYHPGQKYGGDELVEIANGWTETAEVVFAAPNFVSEFRRQTPIPAEQWHLLNTGAHGAKKGEDVKASTAWKRSTGKDEIVIAVLDDGVDLEHPDLLRRIWRNSDKTAKDRVGRDFFLPDDHPDHYNPRPKLFQFPYDEMKGNDIHGTCCAGVAAAAGLAGAAIGVAPGCRILAIKIFHADQLAASERVANAIRYAATRADVLSCSWTGGTSPDIQQALEDAGQLGREGRGCAVFCAAGNERGRSVGFPANDPNAIAIGASTDLGTLAEYSNVGPEIAFVAPSSGGNQAIFTTDVSYPGRGFNIGKAEEGGEDGLYTNHFGGTSSATPLAAGVAALVLAVHPELTRAELRDLMARTADKIGSGYDATGHSNSFGYGRINAGKALAEAARLAAAHRQATP